jgi:hypothetical protein
MEYFIVRILMCNLLTYFPGKSLHDLMIIDGCQTITLAIHFQIFKFSNLQINFTAIFLRPYNQCLP